VPLHATAAWGATPADLGKLYSFVTFLSLVLSPLAGALADRVGRRVRRRARARQPRLQPGATQPRLATSQ
tara:strand:- start:490 stop:699 length:210 start_codon:yes stop_codon:yes gene_type:complete